MARALGKALRETGQALDRLGRSLQGNYAFREERKRGQSGLGLRAAPTLCCLAALASCGRSHDVYPPS